MLRLQKFEVMIKYSRGEKEGLCSTIPLKDYTEDDCKVQAIKRLKEIYGEKKAALLKVESIVVWRADYDF